MLTNLISSAVGQYWERGRKSQPSSYLILTGSDEMNRRDDVVDTWALVRSVNKTEERIFLGWSVWQRKHRDGCRVHQGKDLYVCSLQQGGRLVLFCSHGPLQGEVPANQSDQLDPVVIHQLDGKCLLLLSTTTWMIWWWWSTQSEHVGDWGDRNIFGWTSTDVWNMCQQLKKILEKCFFLLSPVCTSLGNNKVNYETLQQPSLADRTANRASRHLQALHVNANMISTVSNLPSSVRSIIILSLILLHTDVS